MLPGLSFLIRTSPDQRSFASFPELIAGYHVLRRFSMPRHPPCTLKNLTTFIDHRRSGWPRLPPLACEGERHVPAAARSPAGRAGGRLPRPRAEEHARGATGNGSTFRQKRCSTTPARPRSEVERGRRQKDQKHGSRGAPTIWQVSWRFILQINLEPQFIHLSKSKLRLDDTLPNGSGSSR